MKIDRVRLKNFKCYEEAELDLDRGVTVVHGLNGSGKSSLLEAMFFALYGARAIERTLEEVVTIGAEEAVVELWFHHADDAFHIRRRVRATEDRAQTSECLLEGPSGVIEGAQDVRATVTELLRMDSEAFLNCAYVRQGEVNTLINASPSDRQDMIDDLLQLGVLEDYRERATAARRAVQRVRDGQQEVVADLTDRIEEKEAEDLHDRLNGLEGELGEVEAAIERYESNRDEAETTLAEAQEILEQYEERRRELGDLDEQIEALETEIQETAEQRATLSEELEALRDRRTNNRERVENLAESVGVTDPDKETVASELETVREEIDSVRTEIEEQRRVVQQAEHDADAAEQRAEDREERAVDRRETAADLEAEVEDRLEALEDRRTDRDEMEATIQELESDLEAAAPDPDAVESFLADRQASLEGYRRRVTSLEADLEAARERVEEAEELLAAGRCPVCGQPVEESPHVDALEERRETVASLEETVEDARTIRGAAAAAVERAEDLKETARERDRLEAERDRVTDRIEELEATIEEKREQIADHREAATDLETDAEDAREEATEARERAADARSEVGALNERMDALQDREQSLEALETAVEEVREITAEIDRITERRSLLGDQNDDRRERLEDLRVERRELAEAIDEDRIEGAREDVHRSENYLEEVEAELEALRDRRDELIGSIDSTKNAIDELESLRERRDRVADRADRLDGLVQEVEQLEATYRDLRGELRQRNVDTLERMLNDTFDLVYGNDSYDRIELSETYELTVYQKDGEPLDPDQLSGGERALFNLSLRCAIYRLLAEGVEGTAPMPPFVLDEPTVFLDAGHVSRLVDLIETMRTEVGVEQIVVVSHDEELIAAADAVVHVEKDPTSNRSHVERMAPAAAD